MVDIDVAMTYLRFVEARHQVWEARQLGLPAPWTDEPIVATYKFTNVFRVLDFGSQYLMTDIIGDPEASARDTLMRCFLYRHTGRPEAWDAFMLDGLPSAELGQWAYVKDTFKTYRGKTTKQMVKPSKPGSYTGGFQTQTGERPVFTAAYLVFPQSQVRGTDKVDSIVDLVARLFDPESPEDVMPEFLAAETQAERYAALQSARGVGPFMAMQVLTDWGYSAQCGVDREDEFVVPGPGARKGAKALAPSWSADDTIKWAVDAIRASPECPLLGTAFATRPPSYMDVQNTLCEFSKHVRYTVKGPKSSGYSPAHPGPQEPPVLPKHWS